MTHPDSIPDATPARILIRGVNWLGDAVMTTPALQRLRQRFPRSHLCLLTPQKIAGLWQEHPSIDRVIAFGPDDGLWRVASRLRAERFDLALVFPNSVRSALEPWMARIPARVGFARSGRRWLLTRPLPPRPGHQPMRKRTPAEIRALVASAHGEHPPLDPRRHQIHEYLHLGAALGADPSPVPPLLHVTPAEIRQAAAGFGVDERRPLLGLNPGAEYGPAKRWPEERFIQAASAVCRQVDAQWIVLGGPGDAGLAGRIAAGIAARSPGKVLNAAGRTSLRELMALLRLCRVLVTNDTGPMHVAAALGTPLVVPFGSTSAELTGPGLPGDPKHHLLRAEAACAPCFLRQCPIDFRCMLSISPERVGEAVLRCL